MKNLVKTFLFVNLFVGAFDAFATKNNLVSRDYDKLNDLCYKYLIAGAKKDDKFIQSFDRFNTDEILYILNYKDGWVAFKLSFERPDILLDCLNKLTKSNGFTSSEIMKILELKGGRVAIKLFLKLPRLFIDFLKKKLKDSDIMKILSLKEGEIASLLPNHDSGFFIGFLKRLTNSDIIKILELKGGLVAKELYNKKKNMFYVFISERGFTPEQLKQINRMIGSDIFEPKADNQVHENHAALENEEKNKKLMRIELKKRLLNLGYPHGNHDVLEDGENEEKNNELMIEVEHRLRNLM